MELDKALEFAVILAWDDLMKVTNACSARAEYRSAPGIAVDYLSIWSVNAEGEQNRMCDYWTWTSSAHASGTCFNSKFHSHQLGQALDCILMNQDKFTRPADACAEGLVLVHPPTGDEHTEAATWLSGVLGAVPSVSRTEDKRVATL